MTTVAVVANIRDYHAPVPVTIATSPGDSGTVGADVIPTLLRSGETHYFLHLHHLVVHCVYCDHNNKLTDYTKLCIVSQWRV